MIIIYVTYKDKWEARRIGFSLIREKYAVCVNIIPKVSSICF